jgi:hypothetical protein
MYIYIYIYIYICTEHSCCRSNNKATMVITDIYVDMYMLEYTIYLYKYVHIYKLRIAPVDRTTKSH